MALIKSRKSLILLFLILALASFFRLWQLDKIPPGIYPDEAMNANDAISNPGKVFYQANNGREGLFINLMALSFAIFGISIWSFKIVPSAIGILTVLGTYLFAKELLRKEKFSRQIALLSSFFLAVSFWHLNFSRIAFRAILVPFILTFSFYFLFKGLRSQRFRDFILSGIIFGLGFYTYISFRMAAFLLAAILSVNFQKRHLFFVFYLLFFILITSLPIGFYFLQNPQDFISRAAPVSIFNTGNPIRELGKSLIFHLGMFNFYGDPNWRHNFSGFPMLSWPIGILFLIGSILSLKKLTLIPRITLFAWFFIMLMPGILTYEGIPHALRTMGVIPAVFVFAGIGGWHTYYYLKEKIPYKKSFILTCLCFLLFVGFGTFYKYFFSWAKSPEVAETFTKRYTDIGYYLNSLDSETQKYVIVNEFSVPLYGISIPGQTPMFIESTEFGRPRAHYLRFEELDQIKIGGKETVIIPLYDGNIFSELQKRFPKGERMNKGSFDVYYFK